LKFLLSLIITLAACGTSHVQVAPVTVQPIHMTIDVNVRDGVVTEPQP
jgi:hypothetical protein